MRIYTLMEKPVLRIDENSTAQNAAELMGKNHIGSLLVTRGKKAKDVGIVTERDIMSKIIAEKRDLNEVKVQEVMSKPLVTVDRETQTEKVLKKMVYKGVGRVLVTEKDAIVGIFSTSDIIKLAETRQ